MQDAPKSVAHLPKRLAALPQLRGSAFDAIDIRIASSTRSRLLGLAWLAEPPAVGLLLPHTRSVHTFGMLFALDMIWLDAGHSPLRIDRQVAPRRIKTCWRARSVLELSPGGDVLELLLTASKRGFPIA